MYNECPECAATCNVIIVITGSLLDFIRTTIAVIDTVEGCANH